MNKKENQSISINFYHISSTQNELVLPKGHYPMLVPAICCLGKDELDTGINFGVLFAKRDFTSAIYAEDCIFEDPTIKFTGKDLYARNLKLLVPFFDHPSIVLQKIEKGFKYESNFVLATWKLRTYLKLPWRPLISIEGNTVYDLNADFKIVRHVESWNVSALQAVGQIFTPSFGRHGE
ncbi:PREDICTED: uncharacterized protein LOC104611825 isoform X2 [Nelumbo nucifera]|uniref:Uncharacterized protein LOC104611825 isoform X2 n=2 Tax=Nelumbo nucifera TaxID=4432 RepID=A0A1U8QC21_NELNU|nr:PREDICTED: uncharacterized protein LOC104611825 isoform X2 [Nelumbo nucifera]DAD33669.1 TPA_asm: hypothetical protein HUJ06_012520 [Nelumbo nucifera]